MYQQPWSQQGTPTMGQQLPQQQQYPVPQQQQYLPGSPMPVPPGFTQQTPFPQQIEPNMLPVEQSYIENILRLNRGKIGTFYMTFENNTEWNAKIFRGVIEAAGRDHIIISDPQSDKRYLLLMIYLDYVTFDEPLDYDYPYNGSPTITYPPR